MAHTIKLGTISKHEESTKRPNMTGWAEYSVVFKDGTDIVNPTITISADLGTVSACNYGYMLGRYYWVRGITSYRTGYVILDLETDVLATYKTEIGSTSLYILRSASAYDGAIPDNWYPPKASPTISRQVQDPDTVPLVDFNTGYYLLSVMGRGTAAGGAQIIYQLTPAQFKAVIKQVYDNIDGFNLSDAWNAVAKAFGGNPQSLISGAVWVPYDFPAIATSNVFIGGYDTQCAGAVVTKSTIDLATFSYTINKHPKASTKGKYLNCAPYSYYTLDINCAGIVELDSSKLVNATSLYVDRSLDIKGQLLTTVHADNYQLAKIYGQMGVPISLNGSDAGVASITSVVSAIGSTAAAAATGGLAVVGAVAAGAGNVASAVTGASSNTSMGSVAGIGEGGKLITTFYDIPDEDNTRNGRPYCKIAQPSSLSGFMIVQRGDVDIPGTLPEQQRIKMFLESGFFYE